MAMALMRLYKSLPFADYHGYYMGKHLYLLDAEISKDAIAAIADKFETDASFNPENIVLFGYSFTWTALEELKVNLARLKATEKNLHLILMYAIKEAEHGTNPTARLASPAKSVDVVCNAFKGIHTTPSAVFYRKSNFLSKGPHIGTI